MSSDLSILRPPEGSRTKKKRVGRGLGSGLGKTAGRGQKGQTSRTGKTKGVRRGFEGGQMPLQRRLPKRGFINPFRRERAVVNVGDLEVFGVGAAIGPEELVACRLVRSPILEVKVLGEGEISHAVKVRAHAFSSTARSKIEAAGGSVEVIGRGERETDHAQNSEQQGS